jgi:RimJ/RimL family protein N-acetyltransferase
MFIEDGDLVLRPVEEEDLKFIRDTRMTPGVREEMGFRKPANLEQMEEGFKEAFENEDHIELLLEYRNNRAGHLSVDLDLENGNEDYGMFLHTDFHGEGLGTRVTELVLEYVFSEFPVNRVDASYRKGNKASEKMQRK